jgi:hypothetical protein
VGTTAATDDRPGSRTGAQRDQCTDPAPTSRGRRATNTQPLRRSVAITLLALALTFSACSNAPATQPLASADPGAVRSTSAPQPTNARAATEVLKPTVTSEPTVNLQVDRNDPAGYGRDPPQQSAAARRRGLAQYMGNHDQQHLLITRFQDKQRLPAGVPMHSLC